MILSIQELLKCDRSELSFGHYNSLVRVESRLLHVVIHFEPFIIIKNALPVPINIELSNKITTESTITSYQLRPQQAFQATDLVSKEPVYLSLLVEGFEQTQRMQLIPYW